MTTSSLPIRPHKTVVPLVRRPFLFAVLTAAVFACNPEGKARKQLAGTYVRQLDGQPGDFIREVLTLRPDGTWHRHIRMESAGKVRGARSDTGDYHLREVTLTLRNFSVPGAPTRYTVAGDSLFQSNAAYVHAITGYDIGEAILVRQR